MLQENEVCRAFRLPEFTLRKYCINRYSDAIVSSRVYYINTEPVKCPDQIPPVWLTDLLKHDHEDKKCLRCVQLADIYEAQCRFVEIIFGLEDKSVTDLMKSIFASQAASSTIFGGYPSVFFKTLRLINDFEKIIESPYKL